ncbi:MAG TPA: ABC transporter permease subunit [Actinoplanes sp.]|jgi:ABC-type transport system involved in multi-copper enzyme maturation permease subunit
MIWLTWRQFRGQAVTAVAVLAALAIYLVVLGLQIRNTYDANVGCGAGCSAFDARDAMDNRYFTPLLLGGLLVVLVPALVGAFWGAPLIARELETGTHRLVWNQSLTRRRWLAVKLGFVTLAGVVLTGALSLLVTWAASPYDKVSGSRFEPLTFPTRNIVPVGYAVFAVVAGIAIGLLARRTVLAMAITLAAFIALQVLMPTVIRPHLLSPVTESVAFTAGATQNFSVSPQGVVVDGYTVPGAWVLTPRPELLDPADRAVTRDQLEKCLKGEFRKDMACIETLDLHLVLSYHPGSRYWLFQWLESGIYLVLAGLLAGFAFWRIRRVG